MKANHHIALVGPGLFRPGIALLSTLIVLLGFAPLSQAEETDKARSPVTESLLADFRDTEKTTVRDVTPQLKRLLAPPKLFERMPRTYSSLKAYYRRSLRAFTALYPGTLFPEPSIKTGLQEYKGKLSLTSFDVFYIPFAPIVPEVTLNLNDLQFYQTATKAGGKTIHGLTVKSSLPVDSPPISRTTGVIYRLTMAYIASVNARVMGFSHAQLIPELSRSITTSEQFEYNGLRPWSQHSRYKQSDQIERPIRLTNYAHQAGTQFNISSHPDFALTARFIEKQGVLMTFFLWKPEAKVLGFNVPLQPSGPPDFVFRLELSRVPSRK